jgi:hypothetical protein
LPPHPLQGGLLETDLYDMPKGFEAKDVASVGGELWKEQLKLPKEEQRYGKGERASERARRTRRTAGRPAGRIAAAASATAAVAFR